MAKWTSALCMAAVAIVSATTACSNGHLVLQDQMEARHAATELRAEFARANEAGNRAVMADTEDASKTAAAEATQATTALEQGVAKLTPLLQTLNYTSEQAMLTEFSKEFGEFKTLDAEILSLAVENTNIKAQQLARTEGQQAADDVKSALVSAVAGAPAGSPLHGYATAVQLAVLQIQVLQPRHISEADDASMTQMEQVIASHARNARTALAGLRRVAPAKMAPSVDAAVNAFERFMKVNAEIIQLSRRNSNVRSLALTLGRKRMVAAQASDRLRQIEEALSQHQFKATR